MTFANRVKMPSPNQRREWLTAFAFLTPQLLGLIVFVGGPLIISIYYTFTKWDLIAPAPTWTGLRNWEYLLFEDPRVGKVLLNTVKFILTGTTSFLILSLGLALLVNVKTKSAYVYRALFALPWVLSGVAFGTMWKWLLNTRSGPLTVGLQSIGIQSPEWLLDPYWAMISISIATTWQALGYGMTIYLAALQGVPEELYDAAKVDGANAWNRFRAITFPMLSPVTFFLTVTSLIAAFQLYDAVVTMTSGGVSVGPGGPQDSTRTIVLYLYNQLFDYNTRISGLGYAATIGWMLAIIIFIVTIIQWRAGSLWVFGVGADDRGA